MTHDLDSWMSNFLFKMHLKGLHLPFASIWNTFGHLTGVFQVCVNYPDCSKSTCSPNLNNYLEALLH